MTPLPHQGTTRIINDGWGGNQPLPVTDISGGVATAWLPTSAEIKALRRGGYFSVVIMDDGSISIKVGPPVETFETS